MKNKFYWLALLASAALIAQAHAGGHNGGGGGSGGGSFAPTGGGSGRAGGGSSFHSGPGRGFAGRGMIYPGQRFSATGMRRPGFQPQFINPNSRTLAGTHNFAAGNFNRSSRTAGFSASRQGGARQVRAGNNLPANWRSHVVAQHSANWHRDWDRHHDHNWHGHHCRFIDGSWVIFDLGFYPWWPYWYPDSYYAYDYYSYPYGYGPDGYDSGQGEEYYNQNGYGASYGDSTVAAAQERLSRLGYYRGEIDGTFGPQTRRAIERYQNRHGLRVTGYLTTDTLDALGLRQLTNN